MNRREAAANGPIGNVYDKYGTRNPLARRLMAGFLREAVELVRTVRPRDVLEVGCGEGHLAHHLAAGLGSELRRLVACDLALTQVAPGLDPRLEFCKADATALPFADRSFDLVVCCEVLEHLDRPALALAEASRVARHGVLVSTPWEPIWRMLNLARGRYWRDLGNTPGHVQHFSRAQLVRLCTEHLSIQSIRTPLPWTMVLGIPKASPASIS